MDSKLSLHLEPCDFRVELFAAVPCVLADCSRFASHEEAHLIEHPVIERFYIPSSIITLSIALALNIGRHLTCIYLSIVDLLLFDMKTYVTKYACLVLRLPHGSVHIFLA